MVTILINVLTYASSLTDCQLSCLVMIFWVAGPWGRGFLVLPNFCRGKMFSKLISNYNTKTFYGV